MSPAVGTVISVVDPPPLLLTSCDVSLSLFFLKDSHLVIFLVTYSPICIALCTGEWNYCWEKAKNLVTLSNFFWCVLVTQNKFSCSSGHKDAEFTSRHYEIG